VDNAIYARRKAIKFLVCLMVKMQLCRRKKRYQPSLIVGKTQNNACLFNFANPAYSKNSNFRDAKQFVQPLVEIKDRSLFKPITLPREDFPSA
jgi:hypothetical protein